MDEGWGLEEPATSALQKASLGLSETRFICFRVQNNQGYEINDSAIS